MAWFNHGGRAYQIVDEDPSNKKHSRLRYSIYHADGTLFTANLRNRNPDLKMVYSEVSFGMIITCLQIMAQTGMVRFFDPGNPFENCRKGINGHGELGRVIDRFYNEARCYELHEVVTYAPNDICFRRSFVTNSAGEWLFEAQTTEQALQILDARSYASARSEDAAWSRVATQDISRSRAELDARSGLRTLEEISATAAALRGAPPSSSDYLRRLAQAGVFSRDREDAVLFAYFGMQFGNGIAKSKEVVTRVPVIERNFDFS